MSNGTRPNWLKVTASFLYMWLVVGFVLGTLVLIGPVRWLTATIQRAGWGSRTENLFVIGLVVVYVIFSAWLAMRLNRTTWRTDRKSVRLGIPVAATLLAVGAAVAWNNPAKMLSALAGGGQVADVTLASGAVFEFGPYPDEKMLRDLKRRGVTAVISLQHPDIPVERSGIAAEAENAKALGIRLVRAPMLPWFSENRAALDTIRAIAKTGGGLYYVHCGLGRDRVNIARKLIEGLGVKAVAAKGYHAGLGFEYRTVPMARGPVVRLAPGVWMVPFPDQPEMQGCFLQGSPGTVVLALDPQDLEQREMLEELKRVFDPVALRYQVMPVNYSEPPTVLSAADSVRQIPPPVTVIVKATRGKGENGLQSEGWENSEAFRKAFQQVGSVSLGKGGVAPPGTLTPTYKPPVEARGEQDTRTGC